MGVFCQVFQELLWGVYAHHHIAPWWEEGAFPTEMLLHHPALLISLFIQCEVDTLTHALYRALRDKPKTKFLNATVSRFVQELLGLRNSFLWVTLSRGFEVLSVILKQQIVLTFHMALICSRVPPHSSFLWLYYRKRWGFSQQVKRAVLVFIVFRKKMLEGRCLWPMVLYWNKLYQFLSFINLSLASSGYIIEEGLLILAEVDSTPFYLKSIERKECGLAGRKSSD